eukprot:SAG11_NODE_10804_length_804_cov_19.255319_2_plen_213_part_01
MKTAQEAIKAQIDEEEEKKRAKRDRFLKMQAEEAKAAEAAAAADELKRAHAAKIKHLEELQAKAQERHAAGDLVGAIAVLDIALKASTSADVANLASDWRNLRKKWEAEMAEAEQKKREDGERAAQLVALRERADVLIFSSPSDFAGAREALASARDLAKNLARGQDEADITDLERSVAQCATGREAALETLRRARVAESVAKWEEVEALCPL